MPLSFFLSRAGLSASQIGNEVRLRIGNEVRLRNMAGWNFQILI